MGKIAKLGTFATSSSFRAAKTRQWLWPYILRMYPSLQYIGVASPEGRATLVPARDKYITVDFLKNGTNSSPMSAALAVLDSINHQFREVFFDIGANIGTESIAAIQSGRFERAIAVELSPSNVSVLRANLALQSLEDRIKVFANGASNCQGVVRVAISNDNCGDHRVDASDDRHGAIEVEVKTPDDILIEAGEPFSNVGLLWLDVQGYEGFVLDGASQLISRSVPLVMEYTPKSLDEYGCHELLLKTLTANYTTFYNLSTEQPRRQAISALGELRRNWDAGIEHIDLLFVSSAKANL